MADSEDGIALDSVASSTAATENQRILTVTTLCFGIFVIAELAAALISGSLSLLGDAAAMSVDVFSYLTNMMAERLKRGNNPLSIRTQFILEVAVPSFSVACLLAVTVWITQDAMASLYSKNAEDGEDLDVSILFAFSSVNMVVDLISFFMFWRRRRDVFVKNGAEGSYAPLSNSDSLAKGGTPLLVQPPASSTVNLNMLSAFSHVGGDTLRTISIFIAAAYSAATKTPGDVCDAWAAAVVALTIVFMVIPLIYEIVLAARRLYSAEVADSI